jgi:hypothetical protein
MEEMVKKRVNYLLKAANKCKRKQNFSACMVYEVEKLGGS